jgi:Immunoglobulin-like domain of bacterial spore germination/Sporulation and spore germination
VLVAGLLSGSGGAARADSHGPKPHATTTISVWFKRSARLWHTKRTVAAATPAVKTAVRALFAGPNAAESAAGVKSAVVAGTRLFSTSVHGHVVTVNVRKKFVAPAPRKRIRMRLAELTFTATQFPGVHAVHLETEGVAVRSIGGVAVPSQMTRAMFARLLPAIVVHTPVIGAQVSPRVRITGRSDVFEAAMVVKVLNSGGHVIAKKFITASCGTGCRGHFGVTLPYHVGNARAGSIVVTDTSARGGRPPNIVRIPVRLSP